MHKIAVVGVPPVGIFELSIPELIFSAVVTSGDPAYEVRACSEVSGLVAATGSLGVAVPYGLDVIAGSDTVIVTGTGAREHAPEGVLAALRDAAAAGKRIASICTGAFILAQAGLLDGRTATTHWRYCAEFARRFPRVSLDPNVLFVEDGPVITSAGLTAGIDLCVHIVRTDHGAATANAVARLAVAAPARPGGQAQFIPGPPAPEHVTSLAATRQWALQRLHEPLTLSDLARHAHVSTRTLTRRFSAETSQSPVQWLLRQRVERARELLETTGLPMGQVARQAGLRTPDSLRGHIQRTTGLTPSAYRAAFPR